jgi:hypothetical protein
MKRKKGAEGRRGRTRTRDGRKRDGEREGGAWERGRSTLVGA